MNYVIVQRFLKIEAIGTWGANNGTPTDPIRIAPYVTPSSDLTTRIEQRDTQCTADKDLIYRVGVGYWAMKLNPALYTPGLSYTVNFKFWATPSNVNVIRQNFIWDPLPELPRNDRHCIVYGTLNDVSGLPVSDENLVVEKYKNIVTLNEREAQYSVRTNSFGIWSIELPIGALVRLVFGNITKAIQVPDLSRAALGEIPDYQPAVHQRDKFGYPFPVGA